MCVGAQACTDLQTSALCTTPVCVGLGSHVSTYPYPEHSILHSCMGSLWMVSPSHPKAQLCPFQAPLHLFFSVSVCLSHSYESSAEILPHTPRLTHFPTVSGSPASLADSMQQKLAGPYRRRPHSPSAM